MSHLEQWGRDRRLEIASEALQPIIQASQLLQARKTDEDVVSICEMCNKLTANQIVKILNLYTPADDYESRVPVSFIKKVQDKLKERGENNEQVNIPRGSVKDEFSEQIKGLLLKRYKFLRGQPFLVQ